MHAFWGTRPDLSSGAGLVWIFALLPWFNQSPQSSCVTPSFDTSNQTFWNIYNNTPYDLIITTPCGSTRVRTNSSSAVSHEQGLTFVATIATSRMSCTTQAHNVVISSIDGHLKIETNSSYQT